MQLIKRHLSKIVVVVFILVVAAGFFVQKLMVKEFQKAENLKHENQKAMLDAAKQAATLRTAYSSGQNGLDELTSMNKQKKVKDLSNVQTSSKSKDVIYEEPSSVIYLAQ